MLLYVQGGFQHSHVCCRKALFEGPEAVKIWLKLLKGVARSSLFLAGYCTFAWRGACTGFQLTRICTPLTISGFAWTGGMRVLLSAASAKDSVLCVEAAKSTAETLDPS